MKKIFFETLSGLKRNSSSRIIGELEGLRFLAIMLVIVQHLSERLTRYMPDLVNTSAEDQLSFLVSRGTIGVFIFFVISGFIISIPLFKQFSAGQFNYATFIRKRMIRILPPYFFWMTLFFLIILTTGRYEIDEALYHYIASMTFSHSLVYGEYSWINPVAWSLEIEIQFYLLSPLLIAGLAKIKIQTRRIVMITGIVILMAIQYNLNWWHFPMKANLLGMAHYFLLGIVLGHEYIYGNLFKKKKLNLDLLVLPLLLIIAYTWTTEWLKSTILIGSMALLFTAAFHSRVFRKVLTWKPIMVIGGMCYTVYLVHLPLLEGMVSAFSRFYHPDYLLTLIMYSTIAFSMIMVVSVPGYTWLEKRVTSIKFDWLKNRRWVFRSFLILVLTGSTSHVFGQEEQKTDAKLLPLSELVELAIQHSPALEAYRNQILIKEEEMKLSRKEWQQHISANGTANYGTGQILDNSDNGSVQTVTMLNRSNLLYTVGIGFRLPLATATTQRNKQKILQYESENVRERMQEQEQLIIENIIRLYTEYKTSLHDVDACAEILEAARVNTEIAEKFFTNGKMEIEQYQKAIEQFHSKKAAYEKAQITVKRNYLLLKNQVGSDIMK